MISYKAFLKLLGELHLPHNRFLPDDFDNIIDDFEYDSKQAAEVFGKSDVTIRRWCRTGQLKYQRKNPYIIKGSDMKQKIFEDHYSTIISQLKGLRELDDHDFKYLLNQLDQSN
ncbi:helix-turn-helix domain-containing protein [Geobacillus sp. E263]|uniref:helix-turn-helix domain-containing protein n=1 Tax=Geobacillus sp. E263 TaxID=391290 RepID=UPI00117A8377|nr:helix-turn-helix domain-containing protein [Geobacillus sp. E263]